MQNCILDKFTFIILCEIFSLIKDLFDQTEKKTKSDFAIRVKIVRIVKKKKFFLVRNFKVRFTSQILVKPLKVFKTLNS